MTTILLATECNEGLGHTSPWLCFANQSVKLGWQVNMAGPNLYQLQSLLGNDSEINIWQSPLLFKELFKRNVPAKSWLELMVNLGYGNDTQLTSIVKAWVSILKNVKPDIVIADYALALIIAAKILDIPCIETGTGYCVPSWIPYPEYFPGEKVVNSTSLNMASELLVNSINKTFQSYKSLNTLSNISELHGLPIARMVISIPELDQYGIRSNILYSGFLSGNSIVSDYRLDSKIPAKQLWVTGIEDTTEDIKVLGYLKPNTNGLEMIIDQLVKANVNAYLAVPDNAYPMVTTIGSVSIVNSTIDIPRGLKNADIYLTNGGMHGVGLALKAGCWPVLMPQHPEQDATAMNLIIRQWGSVWSNNPKFKSSASLKVLQRNGPAPTFTNSTTAEEYMFEVINNILNK